MVDAGPPRQPVATRIAEEKVCASETFHSICATQPGKRVIATAACEVIVPTGPPTIVVASLRYETLRERKIRSGTSGLRAVASRATKAANSTSERAPIVRVRPEPQPYSAAGLTIV